MSFDIWANRSVAKAYDYLGIDYPLSEKAKEPSFTSNWLQNSEHKLSKLIRNAREVNKFHSTFLDAIERYSFKGRIHS